MTSIVLPTTSGGLERYELRGEPLPAPTGKPVFNRVAYAAAHVVVDPFANNDPSLDIAFDWERTLAFRHHLWDLGFGVAEAMDTAQRGMGLSWENALELSKRAIAEARTRPGAVIACGAGTDQLAPSPDVTIDQVIAAYETQIEAIEAAGGRIILMASRALARAATSPDDYLRVYGRILEGVREPVVLHWLGEMFDPDLAGYWGTSDHLAAMETVLALIQSHVGKVDGIKISLLSAEKEIALRRRLPAGVKMYTGDDFNYAELIAGDEAGYSHALLGIFDPIAPAASLALTRLAAGDAASFRELLGPTVPLSRHIFKAPTRFYKTGVVFLAWLNGHQEHFLMAGGQQSARSIPHFAELFRLADQARCLANPEMATERMRRLLAVAGIA
ncbi:dihydrodipicolinate synthase family protein [Kaistia algarum]|uniref:dihydrodipicolinate synthase family protein n=1 Tax=Kaistia algarum TaxID=2083279 RepID=UPI000CE7F615|nr:dihydrodipicolinate synthase family protein [Kaistia algarum]MCX5515852.1 dihydrodipicolinate synthase family protein [Kaistia algarum]PPE80780.1 dihydrodipicolinate synthase family protein [Kaistia algarum]